jgi:hypothetical protein
MHFEVHPSDSDPCSFITHLARFSANWLWDLENVCIARCSLDLHTDIMKASKAEQLI